MPELKIYNAEMQQDIEDFFVKCFTDLGWDYEPQGEHADILNIENVYLRMWCLYDKVRLIGTIAVRALDTENKNAELKRLYVAKEFWGNGYGDMLFKTALNYVKDNNFNKVYADTAKDRSASGHLLEKYGFVKAQKYANCSRYTELFFELEIL